MAKDNGDAALIQVLVDRLENIRLPAALELKEKVDRGERLNDYEIETLEKVLSDADRVRPLLERNSKWQPLAARVMSLYNEITTRALENEQKR